MAIFSIVCISVVALTLDTADENRSLATFVLYFSSQDEYF